MIKAAFLSNINIDTLRFQFRKQYDVFFAKGYNTWQQEFLNPESEFFKFYPEFCFLLIDGKQIIESSSIEAIDKIFSTIENAVINLPLCRFFISDLDVFDLRIGDLKQGDESPIFEYEWQKKLSIISQKYKNAYSFPLKNIIVSHGRNNIYSQKMWYMASSRFSVTGERIIANRVRELIRPAITVSKKCLVLDLDNTLWGGVIGEDGIEGIKLDLHGEGARFYDFQKIIKEIHERGIILAIASRNNEEDVEKIFSHQKMVLKKNDFSAMAISWNAKSDNLVQICQELNIGLDSIVFVDDNPVEREEVRQRLEDVVVADFPLDTSQLPQFAIDIYNQYFYSWDIAEEDLNKTKMYAENIQRTENMKAFSSLEDFLVDMDMKFSVIRVDSESLLRVYQMIQKTNQFNVTTKRYSEADLSAMLEDPKILMIIGHVWDKYGDNGNSILLIARIISVHEAEIDSFLMSCRIMNRSIEFGFLYEAEKMLLSMGTDTIYADYIPTPKNSPAAMFFDDAGYEVMTNDSGTKHYKFLLKSSSEKKRRKCYSAVV